ncbi:MAG: bacteriophage holin [Planctomycetes bacterium]|nr:bacteriophage holin [Planctomycetota bacterium]MCK5577952.1 bacteriophage holin [Planctomycetota bacterium]
MKKLNPMAFGLAAGIFWGVCLFLWTMAAVLFGYAEEPLELFEHIYPWYTVSIKGSFLGLIWGLIDGFVACGIFAWLYNRFA